MIYKFLGELDKKSSLEVHSKNKETFFNFLNNGETTHQFSLEKKALHDFIGALLAIQSKMNKNE